jgi:hypothetical protein
MEGEMPLMSPDSLDYMKKLVGFDQQDEQRLARLRPLFEQHGQAIIDRLHDWLSAFPDTREILAGREHSLTTAHNRWLRELFAGDYGPDYFRNRLHIGTIHVQMKVPPHFVEAMISRVRADSFAIILAATGSCEQATQAYGSLLKILDLDLLIINSAYREERLKRISSITGASRSLIERLIEQGEGHGPQGLAGTS